MRRACISYNGLSISEVPSEARDLGEGEARTRYTLLSECDSTEQSEGLRRVEKGDYGRLSTIVKYNMLFLLNLKTLRLRF